MQNWLESSDWKMESSCYLESVTELIAMALLEVLALTLVLCNFFYL